LTTITGYTTVRDGLSNGYPFVEAIVSALPLCDELLVSDGYSEDGTFNVLQRLAAGRPKIHLTRDRWIERGGGGQPIRDILERVRARVTGDVIFQFDANEVLPPENVAPLCELADTYPRRELFALPYLQFLGPFAFHEEHRFRYVRNLPTIHPIYDGWTFGYRLMPSDLLRWSVAKRLAARAAVSVLQDRIAVDLPEQIVYLPKPIPHYYGLFPESFFGKMAAKVWLQANPEYRQLTAENPTVRGILERYQSDHDSTAFWGAILDLQRGIRASGTPLNKEFPFRRFVPIEEHPPIVRKLFSMPKYEIREMVLSEGVPPPPAPAHTP
jgi:hypothetical protein